MILWIILDIIILGKEDGKQLIPYLINALMRKEIT